MCPDVCERKIVVPLERWHQTGSHCCQITNFQSSPPALNQKKKKQTITTIIYDITRYSYIWSHVASHLPCCRTHCLFLWLLERVVKNILSWKKNSQRILQLKTIYLEGFVAFCSSPWWCFSLTSHHRWPSGHHCLLRALSESLCPETEKRKCYEKKGKLITLKKKPSMLNKETTNYSRIWCFFSCFGRLFQEFAEQAATLLLSTE